MGTLQIPVLLNGYLAVLLHFPRLRWKPPLLRVNIELCIVGFGVLWLVSIRNKEACL